MALAGLAEADKPALQALCELLMEEKVDMEDELKLTKAKLEDCFKILTSRTK